MREVDKIFKEALQNLPPIAQHPAATHVVYGDGVHFIDLGYAEVMREACAIRRAGHAENRARALEMAFDYCLAKNARQAFSRSGEVVVLRSEDVVRSLCARRPVEA